MALIWWLRDIEIDAMRDAEERLPDVWPAYLRREVSDRGGRAGRGRLWVAEEAGPVPEIPEASPCWDTPIGRSCAHLGGVVIRDEDAPWVFKLPGIVTDFDLCRWQPSPEAPPIGKDRLTPQRLAELERTTLEEWGARGADALRVLSELRLAWAERDHLKRREADIIEACERVADGGQYRADIVAAIQRIRRERDEARADLSMWKKRAQRHTQTMVAASEAGSLDEARRILFECNEQEKGG